MSFGPRDIQLQSKAWTSTLVAPSAASVLNAEPGTADPEAPPQTQPGETPTVIPGPGQPIPGPMRRETPTEEPGEGDGDDRPCPGPCHF